MNPGVPLALGIACALLTVQTWAATYECLIGPSNTVDLAASTAGVLSAIHVKRGDEVRVGQIVAELQADVQRADVEISEMRATDNSTLDAKRISAKYEHRKLERQDNLRERGIVSEQVYEDAQVALQLSQAEVAIAESSSRLYTAELQRARALLELRNVRSPIDGVVVDKTLSAGEFASDKEPVMVIAAIDPLHVEAFFPLSELGKVTVGQTATVYPERLIGGGLTATVTVIDPVVDAATSTFGVRLELPNAEHSTLAGLRCTLELDK
jgi:RND family efflux transporter MFP subunit